MSLRRSESYYNPGGKQRLLDMRLPLYSQPIPETAEQPSEAGCVDPLEEGEYWWDGGDDDHSCDPSSTETGTTPPRSVHSDFSPASSWSKDGCFDGDRKRSRSRSTKNAREDTSSAPIDFSQAQISPSTQSKPIAIEPPSPSRSSLDASIPVLSARGDIHGAYFPNHEDPKTRIVTPHPFGKDAAMAHENSVKLAAESCDWTKVRPLPIDAYGPPYPDDIAAAYRAQYANAKYYPSNYPFHGNPPVPLSSSNPPNVTFFSSTSAPRVPSAQNQASSVLPTPSPTTPTVTDAASAAASQTQTSTSNSKSACNSKLQYEKQMARHFTRIVAAKSAATVAVSGVSATAYLEGVSRKRGSKPESPRLTPQPESPAPMTPMSLEEDVGYMSRGRIMTPLDFLRVEKEVAEANRLEQSDQFMSNMHRRHGSQTSPSCF